MPTARSPTPRTSNYDGPDSFTYKANDGAADSNVATVNIDVWQFSVPCGQTIAVFSNRVHVTNVSTENPCPAAVITVTFDGDELEVLKPDHEHVLLRIGVDDWNKELAHEPGPGNAGDSSPESSTRTVVQRSGHRPPVHAHRRELVLDQAGQ